MPLPSITRPLATLAALAGLMLPGLTSAQTITETHYDTVRGWDVGSITIDGAYSGCSMARPGTSFDLGMARENGVWFMVFPTDAPDGTQTEVIVDLDRASADFVLTAFRGLFGVEVPYGWVTGVANGRVMEVWWQGASYPISLSGTAAAIAKVEECDQNRGVRPAASAAPVTAQTQPSATSGERESIYRTVRGWSVAAFFDTAGLQGCVANRSGGNFDVSMLLDARNQGWSLAFPTITPNGATVPVSMTIDGTFYNLTLFSDGVFAGGDVTRDFINVIAGGNEMSVQMDGTSYRISLRGTSAALAAVRECVQRGGVQAAAPVAPTATAPAVVPQPVPSTPQVIENDAYRAGRDCPAIGSIGSPDSQDAGDATFWNYTDRGLLIYWLDFNGQPVDVATLDPGQTVTLSASAGYYFLARDFDGRCYGGLLEVQFMGSTFNLTP